jgi:hypothetical protein
VGRLSRLAYSTLTSGGAAMLHGSGHQSQCEDPGTDAGRDRERGKAHDQPKTRLKE